MKRAKPLKKGDTIGIAAISGHFERELFEKGIAVLESFGFKTFFHESIFEKERYLAGNDERRSEELMALFENPNVNAIMFARGGYGAMRILPLLKTSLIAANPKLVIGYSDITPLLAWLSQTFENPVAYGPMMTDLGKGIPAFALNHLVRMLTTSSPLNALPMGEAKTLKPGKTKGTVKGGCLVLINGSFKTPYEVDTENAILFFEDIDERVTQLDRLLTQLKHAGKLKTVRGIVIGTLVLRSGDTNDVVAMLRDVFADFLGPIIFNYPAGHDATFVTLPLGVGAQLIATETSCSLQITSGLFG